MKSPLVAITQRVIPSGPGGYRCDMLDQAWIQFLDACKIRVFPIPNAHLNPEKLLNSLEVDGLILSGGNNLSQKIFPRLPLLPDSAPERDSTELSLMQKMISLRLPVIGVCRGMQFLNVFHGGNISAVPGHVGVQHKIKINHEAVPQLTENTVNSFHNNGILKTDLAPNLTILAEAEDGCIEAFRHQSLPHYGIMWHPERDPQLSTGNIKFFQNIWNIK